METESSAQAPAHSENSKLAYKPEDIKRTVLMPLDGSPHCERAFLWYAANIKKDGDLMIFVHIVEPEWNNASLGLFDAPPVLGLEVNKIMESKLERGKAICRDFMERAKDCNVFNRAFMHIDSRPGQAVVAASKTNNVDMIIMGNRGVGSMHRAFLGSTSDYVLHHAHRPVLIVTPPEAKKSNNQSKED